MRKPVLRLGWIPSALLVIASATGAQELPQMLVTSAWLAEHLHDTNLVLLHVGDKDEFAQEHIPGAQFITLSDISDPDMSKPHDMSGKTLMLEIPALEKLEEAFQSRGISNDSRIIVYFGKDWVSPSTRVIFTLAYVGLLDRTSLLDGGMPAWKNSGGAVTSEVKSPARGTLTPHTHPELVVDAAWVFAHLHAPGVALIDARQPQSYSGAEEKRMPRAGHIPGAQNLPIEMLVKDSNQLKDRPALEELLRGAGVKRGQQVVSYCYIGQRATLVWFIARMYGYDAHLYDGSWEDWSARKDLPVELSPSVAAHR